MFEVGHAVRILEFHLSARLVQKSSESVSLPDILFSLSPTSLAERLTMLRRDITAHFIEAVLTQPLSITQSRHTEALPAPIEHRLELFPAPPDLTTLFSRLDNLSGVLEYLNTHLFGAIPSSQRATFLKSFSKPLTSGVLNHLLIPALPTSLSELPKYLELLERAVKFESEHLTQILFGPTSGISTGAKIPPENEIKSWVEGIVSHYQKKRRLDVLDQARKMFTDGSSDWLETFQVEWTVTSVTPAPSANDSMLLELDTPFGHSSAVVPTTNGTNGVNGDAGTDQVDNEGWGFDDDEGAGEEGTPLDEEAKKPPNENASHSPTDPKAYTTDEADDDAWGWNDEEDPEPTPMPKPEAPEDDAGGDNPPWVAWDETPPSPPTKKVLPKPATKLEKFSSKGKRGTSSPKIITQPPEPEPISTRNNPNHLPAPAPSTPLSSSWSSSSSTPSQQFQSIPPTPASTTAPKNAPKEYYSVSSGMQDILELVENIMLESSEFSRSTLLAAYLPAPNFASSTSSVSGGVPGSVILNTVPSILDLFRALYPMTLRLGPENGVDFQKGPGKSAATEGSAKRAIQFSNDCLYLEERIQELLPALSSRPGKASTTIPPDVWTIDGGLRGKLEDAGKRVKVYGESWFAKTIVRHPPLSLSVSQISWPFYC